MKEFGYPKAVRLYQNNHIQRLFEQGAHLSQYPFRALFLRVNDLPGPPIRILISVSKRYVRKAVKRNRLKRQIREIIRLHQRILQDGAKERKDTLLVAVLFAGKEMPDYTLMEQKIIQILTRLSQLDEKTT